MVRTDLDDAFMGTCEQCGKEGVKVRRVEAIGMARESRSYYNLCFECFEPRRIWKSGGVTTYSPLSAK